jgi:hypothetical protein
MVQEENDVSYKVADAAATVVQDLLPTLHFTCTAWSRMTESFANQTIEKYWCFLSHNSHSLNFF